MKHRNRLIIYLILGIFVISGMLLVSYGYMGSDVSGNETAKEFVNLSQILKVKYSGGTENLTTKEDGYFAPGSVLTKTFSIKNTGNVNINYGVKLSEIVNDFERKEDLVYELYLEDTLLITDTFPNYDKVLAYSQTINIGETKNYTLKVMYKESNENQIIDQNKTINAKIDFVQTKNTLSNIKILGNSVQGRLPSEYQEVEYIESTGTQYILTEIYPQFDWQFELKFSDFTIGSTSNPPTFFSTEKNESGYYYALNQNTFNYTNVTDSFNFGITNSSNIDTISFDGTSISYNGVAKKTFESNNHTSIYRLLLFRNRLDGNARYASFKLYSFKVFNGDNTLYDLIPCYRKSNNEIGLYDLINNVFYTNQGTGVFKKGNDTFTNNGTPTPTKPIEVESVGDKTVNLFEFDKVKTTPNRHSSYELTENGFIATGILNPGNPNSWRSGYVQYFTKNPLEAGTYTVSWYHTTTTGYEIPENLGMNVYGYDANGSRSFSQYYNAKYNKETKRFSITFTLSERLESFYLELPLFGTTSVVKDAQIEKGTIATAYEPFDKYKIPIKVGKNLLDYRNFKSRDNSAYPLNINDDGTLNYNGNYYIKTDASFLEPGETYTLNCDSSLEYVPSWVIYYSDGTYSGYTSVGSSITIDKSKIPSHIYLYYSSSSSSVVDVTYSNIQLVKGATIGDYEPYVDPINIFLDEQLRKLGSYEDYIDLGNKTIVRKTIKKNLNDYNWNDTTEYDTHYTFCIADNSIFPSYGNDIAKYNFGLCNIFKVVDNWQPSLYANTLYMHGWAQNVRVTVSKEEISDGTVATFKTWLSDKNPYMIRIRAEEESKEIDIPTNLYSINPDAEITVDTEIPATLVKE